LQEFAPGANSTPDADCSCVERFVVTLTSFALEWLIAINRTRSASWLELCSIRSKMFDNFSDPDCGLTFHLFLLSHFC
jgi:hypothetical protein